MLEMVNRLDDLEHVNEKIGALIRRGGPFLVSRNGSTEMESIFYYLNPVHLQRAGIFPAGQNVIIEWRNEYMSTFKNLNICATGWFTPYAEKEIALIAKKAPDALQIPLRGLEPYYVSPKHRWTKELAGKRVAVVSSFANTAVKQTEHAEKIWGADFETLLPSTTTWVPIVTGFPPSIAFGRAEWPTGTVSWKEAVSGVVQQIIDSHVDIVLIGCGGLGPIIADACRANGMGAIVVGGAIQVLFGIKGKRWQNHSVISTFWNDAWVSPASDETPFGARDIEGGCYW